ncbi:MAG: response regulator transcription factor [Rubrivivax sp.]|nr:response regulator transcription factor [Rubrivivax sp.]
MAPSHSHPPALSPPAGPAHIVVAEDQADIRDLIALNLQGAGYEVHAVADGRAALQSQAERASDLLVLDLMMPGLDGLEVCKALRARGRATPILMLTAKATELDRVLGLELGADDYLTKPFSMAELLARVKALLRRAELLRAAQRADAGGAGAAAVLRNGELEIQPARREARVAGRPLELTALEFDLLLHFASHPGRVFSRAQLLDAVWGYSHEGYEHTVTTHINRVRAKVEQDPMRPRFVLTVRGAGYKMRDAPG